MEKFYEYYQVENIARDRVAANRAEIANSIRQIEAGNPYAAESNEERRIAGISRNMQMPESSARAISEAVTARSRGFVPGPEAPRGPALEFLDVMYFERGRRAANCVARVATQYGKPAGTGTIVAPGLFLTNAHVIPSREEAAHYVIEIDMERDISGTLREISRFRLDPAACLVISPVEALDFTLVGIGARVDGARNLDDYGFIPLLDTPDKHSLGEVANIIQHPDGRFKEIVLHENRLVARDNTSMVLHYVADTQPGSSGSPVFNNQWEIIALHHWAGPFREVVGIDGMALMPTINEGIRISAVARALEKGDAEYAAGSDSRVSEALELWGTLFRGGVRSAIVAENTPVAERPLDRPIPVSRPAMPANGAQFSSDGSASWTIPVRLSVSVPGFAASGVQPNLDVAQPDPISAGAEATSWQDEDFSNRAGYEPGFIHGHVVPMPELKDVPGRAARNILAGSSDPDPEEFRYHHYSVKLNAERGLCYFTAANIDGERLKRIDRKFLTVKDDPDPGDYRAESLTMDRFKKGGDFMPDRRVKPGELMTQHFYETQKIGGLTWENDRSEFMARMYQRGHVVLRGDIGWGLDEEALAADRDSYFFTNICPQVGAFNMGVAPDGSGGDGKLHWREVETYVLRNALVDRQRVCVFAGPVFDAEKDLPYRFGSKVPLRFWKVAAWSDDGALRVVALLADQSPLIEIRPENFTDPQELVRMKSFLSSVAEIETLTGLDFGPVVRKADIATGSEPAIKGFPADIIGNTRIASRTRRSKRRKPSARRTTKT